MSDLVTVSDEDCKNNLRMDRSTFHRCVKFQFKRSSQTVSTHFHAVLQCVLKFHNLFFVKPQSVADDCSDPHWGKFKGCLGALDGTYIDVHVPTTDKGRYRNRKGTISINVLGVCDMDMKFAYVLTGWEGSATNSRVLRDAINRVNSLKVPKGNYYLCDNGYPNCEVHRGIQSRHVTKSLWHVVSFTIDPIDLVNEVVREGQDEEGETGDGYVPLHHRPMMM
ncbi:hypothetical protein ACS0TY_007872 [Phlomoides rotata]